MDKQLRERSGYNTRTQKAEVDFTPTAWDYLM